MGHVIRMTSASSVALMTLFVVDLLDMYFLSLLGEAELAAAIGYSGTILFFTTSIAIGMAITTGAMVSKSLGENKPDNARRYATHILIYGLVISLFVSALVWLSVPSLLGLLGANGRSLELATQYLRIIIPSMMILSLAMSASGVLRASGDAKRAMMATVWGGLVNAILDPVFIFVMEMGIEGAAWASVCARITVLYFAFHGVCRIHNLAGKFNFWVFVNDLPVISRIAIPAMLTNIATPIGNAYVIAAVSKFGDSAVAGMSIVGRVTPVAFGVIFALSGAVGPIIGQNFGARKMDRVKQTMIDANKFSLVTVVSLSILLYFLQDMIISGFSATEDAAIIISLFCTWLAISFIFNGTLFIANATFNNLGYAHYSTLFNFAKATLGTIPFVYAGSQIAGASGVLIGQAIGTSITGLAAVFMCFQILKRCEGTDGPSTGTRKKPFNLRIPIWPQTETRG